MEIEKKKLVYAVDCELKKHDFEVKKHTEWKDLRSNIKELRLELAASTDTKEILEIETDIEGLTKRKNACAKILGLGLE